jgi:hypothetical protein
MVNDHGQPWGETAKPAERALADGMKLSATKRRENWAQSSQERIGALPNPHEAMGLPKT